MPQYERLSEDKVLYVNLVTRLMLNIMRINFSFLFFIGLAGFCSGCETSPREKLWQVYDKSRARPAAYAGEGFTLHSRTPEPRPVRNLEFYFKDCSIVDRGPLPTSNVFECSGP